MDTFWLMWILYEHGSTNICSCPCFHFLWVYITYPEVELLHMIIICLDFDKQLYYFPLWLHHFMFPPAIYKGLNFSLSLTTLVFFIKILFSFREIRREGVRERNTDVRVKHWSVACHTSPNRGTKPATQARALMGNQTGDLSLCWTMPNQLNHTSQGSVFVFDSSLPNRCGVVFLHGFDLNS